jgi:hypothetical protein
MPFEKGVSHSRISATPKAANASPLAPAGGPGMGEGPFSGGTNHPAEFHDAHAHARSGNPYTPSTPGKLGHNPMYQPDMDREGSVIGAAQTPGRVEACDHNTFAWPDATGGKLGKA